MKLIFSISALFILSVTLKGAAQTATPRHFFIKKATERLDKIQKFLNSSSANAMEKQGKELLLEYYNQTWDGKKTFKDTTVKVILNRDKNGNLVSVTDYDFTSGTPIRTSYTKLVLSPVPSEFETNIKQYWYPTSSLMQVLQGKKWQNQVVDSFRFTSNNEINDFRVYVWDSAGNTWHPVFRVIPLNNSHGVRAGFEVDTMGAKGWNKASSERTDTIYNSNKQITGIQVYRPDSTGKLILNFYEKYSLNTMGQIVSADRWNLYTQGWIHIDSFTNISWFVYDTHPLNLYDDFIEGQKFLPSTINTLLTGGNLLKTYNQFHLNPSTDMLEFYQGQSTIYTSDSLPKININAVIAAGQIDSFRMVSQYYPDNGVITVRVKADSSQHWTGVSWFTDAVDSNVYSYDANNYVQSVINKSYAPQTAKTTISYRDTYVYSQATSGIEQVGQNGAGFILYPNPTTGLLKLRFTLNNKEGKIRVLTMNGQCISEAIISANTNEIGIDVSRFVPGMYILQYTDSGNFYVNQFIKQ